jgi:hypothetical protein
VRTFADERVVRGENNARAGFDIFLQVVARETLELAFVFNRAIVRRGFRCGGLVVG